LVRAALVIGLAAGFSPPALATTIERVTSLGLRRASSKKTQSMPGTRN
jgi:hypothetical protein